MSTFISIPREALAELLRAAGSPLTPEQYLAEIQQQLQSSPYAKYPGRAWAAAVSKYSLLVVAIFGVLVVPFLGSYLENGIVLAILGTVTYFEFRVHRYFRENDSRAPDLGYRNEAGLSVAILIYCLYHAFAPVQMSDDMMTLVETNNVISPDFIKGLSRIVYLTVAIVAGGSQFALACYYRSAKAR